MLISSRFIGGIKINAIKKLFSLHFLLFFFQICVTFVYLLLLFFILLVRFVEEKMSLAFALPRLHVTLLSHLPFSQNFFFFFC